MRAPPALSLACLLFLVSVPASAYQVTRTAVSGGALPLSAGGSYRLQGTVAEAGVVGSVSGGSFALGEGFWPGLAPLEAVGAPELIAVAGESFVNSLGVNFPNPFGTGTAIDYSVASASVVSLVVFDVAGRRVATLVNTPHLPGRYRALWDGRNAQGRLSAGGVYFYRIDAGSWTETRKMIKLR